MARSRPYRTLSIDDLSSKVRNSTNDDALLVEVAHELEKRTTQRARALAREVERLRSASRPPGRVKRPAPARKQSPVQPQSSIDERAGRGNGADDGRGGVSIETKYEALRETFTLEAEILSRWGLTSLAPSPLRDLATDFWRQVLSAGAGHPLGLTSADLERDLLALAMEEVGTTS